MPRRATNASRTQAELLITRGKAEAEQDAAEQKVAGASDEVVPSSAAR
jgi:hypothetical protein